MIVFCISRKDIWVTLKWSLLRGLLDYQQHYLWKDTWRLNLAFFSVVSEIPPYEIYKSVCLETIRDKREICFVCIFLVN